MLVQSAGIVLSILLSAYLMIRDKRSRRLANYIQLVQYHRDIWRMTLELDGLDRVTSRDPALSSEEPSVREAQFLTFIFLHMTCSFELAKQNEIITIEQLQFDFTEFLKAPLVAAFWSARKQYYNTDFAAFVDGCVEKPKQKLDPVAPETNSHSVAAAPTPKRPRKQRKAG